MTLFISEKNKKTVLKELILYIGITAFIALFGFVYEQFSHGVNSLYMWLAWLWVLEFGVIPYLLLYLLPIKKVPGTLTECVYNLGVAFLTVRSIFKGVLQIYGKTNSKMVLVYTILVIVFIIAGLGLYLFGLFTKKETKKKDEFSDDYY